LAARKSAEAATSMAVATKKATVHRLVEPLSTTSGGKRS